MLTDSGREQEVSQGRENQLIEEARLEAFDWKVCAASLTGGADLPSPDVFPGYTIVREMHRGGQGVVYEAVQLATKRTVAIKALLQGPFADGRSKWRFEREVKLVADLRHPDIVVIHDSGIAQGRYFYAMDYVRGQPLDTHICLAALPLKEIVQLLRRVCETVAFAHRRGVIHRDLKPSNILVNENGAPCLLDFGLAKVIGDGGNKGTLTSMMTMPGNILGTLAYMSPEQTQGDPEAIDTRTDVYALGVILYQVLTGRLPYTTGGTDLAEALRTIREVDPTSPSRLRKEINSELAAIVLKAMAKEPDRRYQSAAELSEDLAAFLEGRPVTARSTSSLYVLRKLATKHYFHTSVIAALVCSMTGFGGITYHALTREQEASDGLRRINTQYQSTNQDLTTSLRRSEASRNQHALGWFLLEWHAGRIEAARSIQNLMPRESPEYAATQFLMDGNWTVEKLRASVPANAAPLVLFVTGERYLKDGKVAQAEEAFREYVKRYRGVWQPLAEERLKQLAGKANPVTQASVSGGE